MHRCLIFCSHTTKPKKHRAIIEQLSMQLPESCFQWPTSCCMSTSKTSLQLMFNRCRRSAWQRATLSSTWSTNAAQRESHLPTAGTSRQLAQLTYPRLLLHRLLSGSLKDAVRHCCFNLKVCCCSESAQSCLGCYFAAKWLLPWRDV